MSHQIKEPERGFRTDDAVETSLTSDRGGHLDLDTLDVGSWASISSQTPVFLGRGSGQKPINLKRTDRGQSGVEHAMNPARRESPENTVNEVCLQE